MNSPAIDEVNKMRNIAKDKAMVGGFGIDSVTWFKTITKKINLLKQVDDQLAIQNTKLLEEVASSSKISTAVTLIAYITFAVVTFFVMFFISKGVNRSVHSSLEKISCISSDLDLTCDVIVKGDDEISQISQAIHVMIVAFKFSINEALSVSSTTTKETNVLKDVVSILAKNGSTADEKIIDINKLVTDIGERLDNVERSFYYCYRRFNSNIRCIELFY